MSTLYRHRPSTSLPPQPTFVRRCQHRALRGMLPSEKLRGAAAWTVNAQRNAMLLLEIAHDVVAYRAWPLEVEVRVGRNTSLTYFPSMGLTFADGRRAVLDFIYSDDLPHRESLGFDSALGAALARLGWGLVLMRESSLRADPRLALAREIRRASGRSVNEAASFALCKHVSEKGGSTTLGNLRSEANDGDAAVTSACVLIMRRALTISIDQPSLDNCRISLPSRELVQ